MQQMTTSTHSSLDRISWTYNAGPSHHSTKSFNIFLHQISHIPYTGPLQSTQKPCPSPRTLPLLSVTLLKQKMMMLSSPKVSSPRHQRYAHLSLKSAKSSLKDARPH